MKRIFKWLGIGLLAAVTAHEVKTIARIRHDNWKLRKDAKRLQKQAIEKGLKHE